MVLFSNFSEVEQVLAQGEHFAVMRLGLGQADASVPHTHPFCEIYCSVSGEREAAPEEACRETEAGELWIIPPDVSHRVGSAVSEIYERYCFFVQPSYIRALSSPQTDLGAIFLNVQAGGIRLVMTADFQRWLHGLLVQLLHPQDFGGDLLENAAMTELLVVLGAAVRKKRVYPPPPRVRPDQFSGGECDRAQNAAFY